MTKNCRLIYLTGLLVLIVHSIIAQRRIRRHGKHAPGAKRLVSRSDHRVDNCDTKFVKYQSSPYESKWLSEINIREKNVCLYLLQEINEQTLMYQITQESHDSHFTNMTKENLFRVFSMFIYQRTCPNAADNMVV